MSHRNYRLEIAICCETDYEEFLLSVIEKSLRAEVLNPIESSNITKIELISSEKCVKIYVNANSLSRIRAIMNSYLYLVYSIRKTIDIVKNLKQH